MRIVRLFAVTGLLAAYMLLATPAMAPEPSDSALDPEIQQIISQIDAGQIDSSIQTLAGFGTRNSCSDNSGAPPGIGAARDWIQSQFAAIPGLQVALDSFDTTFCGSTQTIQNVIAWIPGNGHPDRIMVIGGHYDSRTINSVDGVSPAPGANDSGSQTALVLEAARVMAGHSYDATIVFAAWAGEEQGLHGSSAFVRNNYTRYFPTGAIEFNLNCDIVGGDNTVNDAAALQQFRLYSPGTPREISAGAEGSTDNTSPSRDLMRFVGDWGSRYVPEMTMLPMLREDRPGRGGDHESFIAGAIPGVRFIEPAENLNHQHSPNDLYDFVTPSYTARVARVMVAVASSLARAPAPPQSFSAGLTDADTVNLTWDVPATGPDVDHYAIAARVATENFYRNRFVATGTSATARITEDLGVPPGADFFISVAAVDTAGHESLFAYPEYRCNSEGCVIPDFAFDVTATR